VPVWDGTSIRAASSIAKAWALRLQALDSLQAKLQALAVLQSVRSVADAACLADNTPGDLPALPLSLKSH
jgi:hypothetical protein